MKNDTISRKLVERELPPRQSRHGKPIVTPAEFAEAVMAKLAGRKAPFELSEVGVRKTDRLMVANGPTQKKGLMNGGVDAGVVPGWWKEER